ncbi:hypothetical protein PJ267_09000 [Arthrobacter sp. OVS8]|nr:hypothetical protein PJ267_09000 [Arthrobacter sp. OVS8]
MAGNADKAATLLKNGGNKAKAGGAKLYALAKDPEVQAKAAKLLEDGKSMYRAAMSPEAQRAYRQAAEFINRTRRK